MTLFQRSEMHKKEERRGRMGGLEAREIGIKKDGKEVRGGEGAWGTSRPRRDKSVPDEGWDPLGVMGGVEQGPARAVRPLGTDPALRLRRGSRAGSPSRSGGREARVSTVLKRGRQGSLRESAGTCGPGGVLRSWLSGPVKNCGTRVWGVHSARSRAYCGACRLGTQVSDTLPAR